MGGPMIEKEAEGWNEGDKEDEAVGVMPYVFLLFLHSTCKGGVASDGFDLVGR